MKQKVAAGVLALLLCGCAYTGGAQDVQAQREAALYLAQYQDAQRATLQPVTGAFLGKARTSRFIAFVDGRDTVLIEEAAAEVQARYYFRQGQLYLIRQVDAEGRARLLWFDGAEPEDESVAAAHAALAQHAEHLWQAVQGRPEAPLFRQEQD